MLFVEEYAIFFPDNFGTVEGHRHFQEFQALGVLILGWVKTRDILSSVLFR